MGGDDNIRVCCRFRPVNKREIEEESNDPKYRDLPPLFSFLSDQRSVRVINYEKGNREEDFSFDRIFSSGATLQSEVYEYVAKPTVSDVLRGYNGTIFAYGQTGSGKTHSMFGPKSDPNLRGIIPRVCRHIFDHIMDDSSAGVEWSVKCSFLEIYRENVRDLLSPTGENLKTRETPARGVWVDGLTEHYVTSEDEVLDFIKLGERYRSVSATKMNEVSSRSHSLFVLIVMQKTADGTTKSGRLNLADLAGSEKVGKTGARGESLEEAKKINQSLSSLGNCIHALSENKKAHVPYRDSKLTHVLKESLGGNTKTTLVVCCSPHPFNIEETLSTLRFAARAKAVKNAATVNAKRSVQQLEALLDRLTKKHRMLTKYAHALFSELSSLGVTMDQLSSSDDQSNQKEELKMDQEESKMQETSNQEKDAEKSIQSDQTVSQKQKKPKNKEIQEKTEQMTKSIQSLRTEILELGTKIDKVKENRAAVRVKEEDAEKKAAAAHELQEKEKSETEKWHFRLNQSKIDASLIMMHEKEADETFARLDSEIESLSQQINQVEEEAKEVEEEIKNRIVMEKEIAEYTQKMKELQAGIKHSEEEIEAVQLRKSYVQSKKEAVDALNSRVALLDGVLQRRDQLKSALDEKEQVIADTQKRVSDMESGLEKEHEKWKTDLALHKNKEIELETELGELQQKYDELVALHSDADSKVQSFYSSEMKEIEAQEFQRRALREQEESEAHAELERARKSVAEAEAEQKQLERQKVATAFQLEKDQGEGEALGSRLEKRLEMKKAEQQEESHILSEIDSLKEGLTEAQKGKEEEEKREEKVRREVASLQSLFTSQIQHKNECESRLWATIKEGHAVAEKEQEINRNQKKNEHHIEQLNDKRQRIAERVKGLKERNEEMEAKNKRIEEEIEEAKQRALEFQEKSRAQQDIIKQMVTENRKRGGIARTVVRERKRDSVFGGKAKASLIRMQSIKFRLREGWLVKEGGLVRNWKRRYFVLTRNNVSYFKTNYENEQNLGSILLTPECCAEMISSVRDPSGEIKTYPPHSFAVYHPTDRTFFLQADDQREAEDWVDEINKAIDSLGRRSTSLGTPSSQRQVKAPTADGDMSLSENILVSVDVVPGYFSQQQQIGIKYSEGMKAHNLKSSCISSLNQMASKEGLEIAITKFCLVEIGDPLRVLTRSEEISPTLLYGFQEVMAHLEFYITYSKSEVKVGNSVPVSILVKDPVGGGRPVERHNGELLVQVTGPLEEGRDSSSSSSSSSSSTTIKSSPLRNISGSFARRSSFGVEAQGRKEYHPTFPVASSPGVFSANIVLNEEGSYHFKVHFNGYEVQNGPAIIIVNNAKGFSLFQ